MLTSVRDLKSNGFAIHWLKPNSKAPIANKWASVKPSSWEELKRSYREGYNVGVRLGKWSHLTGDFYLHVIDFDIRDRTLLDEAVDVLKNLFPDFESYPTVQSGSRGPSRHFYIVSDKPFPKKKLAHSREKMLGADGKWHWRWEIDLFGTGTQVALPPSIHPDTGKTYVWLQEFDFEDLYFGIGPVVDSAMLETLTGGRRDNEDDSDDDERSKPIGLSMEEAEDVLEGLPKDEYCDDRDGWLIVGMALHHEFKGSEEAFDTWCGYSKHSEKFDKKDNKRVWKSFKTKAKPVRMATLQSAVREAQLDMEFENLDDDFDDMEDEFAEKVTSAAPVPGRSILETFMGAVLGEEQEEPEKEVVPKRVQKLRKAEVEAELGNVPPKVKRMNEKHAVAFVNGKTVIITDQIDYEGRWFTSYGTPSALHEWYENDRVATEKATEPVSKAWMRHKKRREYPKGIVFAPNRETPGYYNHWRGFDVEPDPEGSCKRILWHIKEIMCGGDEEYYNYLIGWMAHMIQRPEEKPGVAVVIRGKKGAGKDTVAVYLGHMFSNHHVQISQQDHLVGRFNQHQEKCLLLHVEEGFWAGNKSAEGTLKNLITSEKVFIEPKGLNGFNVPSVLRLFMTSNENWVVPASFDERRYFILDIDPRYSRVGDMARSRRAYFAAIREEMLNGGTAALLYYLQNVDLRNFDVRDPPDTHALGEQKMEGLKNVEKWWLEQLQAGELDFDCFATSGPQDGSGDWHRNATVISPVDIVKQAYDSWMQKHRFEGEPLSTSWFGRRLSTMAPSIVRIRGVLSDDDVKGRVYYRIPMLGLMRKEFTKNMNSKLNWPIDDIEEIEDIYDDDMG